MKTLLIASITAVTLTLAGCGAMGGGAGGTRTAGQVVDDATILTKIKAAYAADPDISALKINVDSEKGVVRLRGEVKSVALWRKAEDVARKVEGVKSVENRLIVTG